MSSWEFTDVNFNLVKYCHRSLNGFPFKEVQVESDLQRERRFYSFIYRKRRHGVTLSLWESCWWLVFEKNPESFPIGVSYHKTVRLMKLDFQTFRSLRRSLSSDIGTIQTTGYVFRLVMWFCGLTSSLSLNYHPSILILCPPLEFRQEDSSNLHLKSSQNLTRLRISSNWPPSHVPLQRPVPLLLQHSSVSRVRGHPQRFDQRP